MTSQMHTAKVGQMVFAKADIPLGAEDASQLVTEFKLGDPIYGRFYLKRSMENEYRAKGWGYPSGDYPLDFKLHVTVDGKELAAHDSRMVGEWTTYKFSFTRSDSDSGENDWYELDWFLSEVAPKLEPGKHTIGLTVNGAKDGTKETAVLAQGQFALEVGADRDQQIATAKARETSRGKANEAKAAAEKQKMLDDGWVWVSINESGDECTRVSWKYKGSDGGEYNSEHAWMKPGTQIKKCVESIAAEGCQGACTTTKCASFYQVTKDPEQQVDGDCL